MSVSSMSTALIPYTPPKTPMEFIRSEVERGLKNGTIKPEQVTPKPSIHSAISELIDLNLSTIAKIFGQHSDIQESSLSSRRIDRQMRGHNPRFAPIMLDFEMPMFLSSSSMHRTPSHFSAMSSPKIPEEMQKLLDSLEFDTLHAPSRVTSSKKLNGDEIAEALQAEAAFTIATDKKPIVATYGAGPCVALGGYDATNKIAFVVHFSNAGEVRKSGGLIFYNIAKLAKEKIEKPIQLHLRGGIEGQSEATVEAIKLWMKQRDDLPMEIASEDILDSGMSFGGKSLSIDSRNGEVAEYDPMANPSSRGMSELDAMSAMMSAFEPRIKLAYSPK